MILSRGGIGAGGDAEQTLVEEIAVLEGRLRHLGGDGDCAYERALGARYLVLVEDRKARLLALRSAGRT
jgi:hypothetical protein